MTTAHARMYRFEPTRDRAPSNGDESFGDVWRRQAPALRAQLLHMAPRQDVDDLLQDVALRAFLSIDDLEDRRRVGAWLRTIARNVAHDASEARRGDRRALTLDESGADAIDDGVRPDDVTAAEEILAHVRALPDTYRAPLLLKLELGLDGAEIARRTGMTPGSARVNICRGMRLLRRRLDAAGEPRFATDRAGADDVPPTREGGN